MLGKLKVPALIICFSLFISCNGKNDMDEEQPGNQIDMADPATIPDSSTQVNDTSQPTNRTRSDINVDQNPVNKGEIIDTMSSQKH
jgi:hypothetical protein